MATVRLSSERKRKLDGLFKKKKGRVTNEIRHTVQFVPEGKTEVTLSTREIVRLLKTERKQKTQKKAKQYAHKVIEKKRVEETAQVFADLEQEESTTHREHEGKAVPARMSRNRRAPDRYGLPVYICGVVKNTSMKLKLVKL